MMYILLEECVFEVLNTNLLRFMLFVWMSAIVCTKFKINMNNLSVSKDTRLLT